MDALRSMRLFARAIELGSFSAVAREEGITQPTISKVIAALERQLGVRRCTQLVEEYLDAVADVRGQTLQVVGQLTVSAPVGLGELRLNGLALEFLVEHPGIEIELILNDRMVDLVEEGVDVAIRLGDHLPPNVVARNIAMSPRVLVAAPDYLRRAPKLCKPQDLTSHEYIRFARLSGGDSLEFTSDAETIRIPTQGRYRVNSSHALRECFLLALGLGSAPAWLVQDLLDKGELVRLLADWRLPPQPVHLVYASRRHQPRRTRAFLQFMSRRIPGLPGIAPVGAG